MTVHTQHVRKDQPTLTAVKLMEQAEKNASSFLTGHPKRVLRYGRNQEGKVTFVTFETERGMEETYARQYSCLQDAVDSSAKIVSF